MSALVEKAAAVRPVLERFDGQPLTWGRIDCVRMVAPVLKARGYKPALARGGSYTTEAAALSALKKAGYKDLAAALDDLGLVRIPPAAAVIGDIIGFPADPPWSWALALALGNGRVLIAKDGVFRVRQPDYRGLVGDLAATAWAT